MKKQIKNLYTKKIVFICILSIVNSSIQGCVHSCRKDATSSSDTSGENTELKSLGQIRSKLESKPYIDSHMNFEIYFPKEWKVVQSKLPGAVVLARSPQDSSMSITITRQIMEEVDLATLIAKAKALSGDYKIHEDKKMMVNGNEAWLLGFSGHKETMIRTLSLSVLYGKTLFSIQAGGPAAKFSEFEEMLFSSIKTFRALPNSALNSQGEYVNATEKYRVTPPKDWKIIEDKENSFLQFKYWGIEGLASIIILIDKNFLESGKFDSVRLKEAVELYMKDVSESQPNYKKLGEEEFLKNGWPLRRVSYSLAQKDINIRAIRVFVGKEQTLYMIEAFAFASHWPKFEGLFDKVIDSFELF